MGISATLLLVSLRHWRLRLFASGLATLVAATVLLHVLGDGLLAFHVARFGYTTVFSAVAGLLEPVATFVHDALNAVFDSMFGPWP